MLREKIYEWKNWKQILHTTWNPKGPGVIRIHMIPPKFRLFQTVPAVVILNGQEILPLNESWAILLTEFIRGVNEFGPGEMTEEELEEILYAVFRRVRCVYPEASDKQLRGDLELIVDTFEDVARGEIPRQEIGMMNLGEYAPYMNAPHRMDLLVSSMTLEGNWHCNQKCLHCYAAEQPLSRVEELPFQEWKEIIAKCRKAGIPQLTFTGGEPTMREDLCGLIKEARWFVTRLNTNGVKLTGEFCRELLEAELDSVQITFYSADREIHNRLVGAENYDRCVEGIKNALAAGLNVSINTPLCSLNRDYVKTLRFLWEMGIRYVTCSGLIMTGKAALAESAETRLESGELEKILREATAFCYENEMEINFTSPGWLPEETLKELLLDVPSCGACLSNMAITPDGKVIPCQSWLNGEILGDMRQDEWKKIWNHPDCKKHRAFSAETGMECPLKGKEAAR